LLDQLGCRPVVAVGHSLGGAIVSALAVERADLVRAVVSVDPGYQPARSAADGTTSAIAETE
jgi:pimeloyl-ACP methyl ester carboxylesterase